MARRRWRASKPKQRISDIIKQMEREYEAIHGRIPTYQK